MGIKKDSFFEYQVKGLSYVGKKKKSFVNADARSRYFRLLLYPDNSQHSALIDRIKAGEIADDGFLGIMHQAIEGIEKEHYHFVLFFVHPRETAVLCKHFGFVNDLGEPDDTFVRAIVRAQNRDVDKQITSCTIYLTHRNAPEKEQYDFSSVFGSDDRKADLLRDLIKYESTHLDMSDAVLAVLDYISTFGNDFIRIIPFGKWLCKSPYFKCNGNKLVWAALREHNLNVLRDKQKDWIPADGFDTVNPDFEELSDDEWENLRFVFGGE